MKNYNEIYSSSNISEEIKPSQILNLVWQTFTSGCNVLDLGCGQGRDSIFLAKNGFKVTAVDKSEVAINQLFIKKDEFNLENFNLVCGDITSFKLSQDEYQVVICRNVLNFLNKEAALVVIEGIKENVKVGGYVIIEVFTKDDPSFSGKSKFASYFDEQELLNIFFDYKKIYYLENTILDPGHLGFTTAHKHGVSRIVAMKRN